MLHGECCMVDVAWWMLHGGVVVGWKDGMMEAKKEQNKKSYNVSQWFGRGTGQHR